MNAYSVGMLDLTLFFVLFFVDPHELVDVSEDQSEITAQLRMILMARLEEQKKRLVIYRATSTAIDSEIDPALLEQMRSLGYIE